MHACVMISLASCCRLRPVARLCAASKMCFLGCHIIVYTTLFALVPDARAGDHGDGGDVGARADHAR